MGVSAVVQYRCRLTVRERHLHCPTLPALAPGVDPQLALTTLEAQLRNMGFADAHIGSYDAGYLPPSGTAPRLEYIISIPPSGDVLPQLGETHRRYVRRGEREGWALRFLSGAEAEAAILCVQQYTAARAAALQRGFSPVHGVAWASTVVPSLPLPDYGLAVLGAYRKEHLLSSILIGWAAARAFYLIGGSTSAGYQCGAAAWLHSQAIQIFAAQGIRTYNLGGTPIDAASESSPAHGLYRFKTGFGVSPVERRGVHWELRPRHTRLHGLFTHLLRRPQP